MLGWLLVFPGLARAHDPGLSVLELRLESRQLTAHFTFARREIEPLVPIDGDRDGTVSPEELAAARPRLVTLAHELLAIGGSGHGTVLQVVAVDLDDSDALHFRLAAPRSPPSGLSLSVPVLSRLAVGHRQYAAARDGRGQLIRERVLDARRPVLTLDRPAGGDVGSRLTSFREFLLLGLQHILGGWDHLLFLVAVLVVGGSLVEAVRIITSFTVAHSLTLALATLGVVRLPSSLVEPLIAASIVCVGLDNLRRHPVRRRWLLTFGFGLVHGLGFAGALTEVGLGPRGGVVVPLVAFNLGVEVGQLAVALAVLPLIRHARQHHRLFPRFAAAASVLVVAAGAYWLLDRTVFS